MLATLPGTLAAPLRHKEKDVNEGVWPGSVNKPARELRLAVIRRKDDVMQRRGVSRLRGPRLLPFGVSVPVFSSGESQTGFHRESLQITSILARRKQNLHPAGSTPLFLPLLSFSISFPPPFLFPSLSPSPPPSGVSVYSNQRPHLHARKGKKHLWLREEEEKRERKKLAWLWKMTLQVAKPASRVVSIVS